MSLSKFPEYNLPRNAYTAFDASSMKQLIINRLKENNTFKDIDFEGSNISGVVDIIAYMYHVLVYYLNQTGSEALFSQAEIYENVNKLVSLIGYKPDGFHTASLLFNVVAGSDITPAVYVIPRFSRVFANNAAYTLTQDLMFEKSLSGSQLIDSITNNYVLYQGNIKEYTTYTAIGTPFEQLTLTLRDSNDDTVPVDHNQIFVFVKDAKTQKWSEWNEVPNLFFAKHKEFKYEKRLNENYFYEIKFGNDINGKQLNAGDLVSVFYLQSDGDLGKISSESISNSVFSIYNTELWNEIFNDIKVENKTYLSQTLLQHIRINNTIASTVYSQPESVNSIKENAALSFSSQNRAITVDDYTVIAKKHFNYMLTDLTVCSNNTYTSEVIKYYYDIGLERPNANKNVLMNQVMFADACDFNNIYIFTVGKYSIPTDNQLPTTIIPAQKQMIVDELDKYRSVNHNIVIGNTIFKTFDFGLNFTNEEVDVSICADTKLIISRYPEYTVSRDIIKGKAINIITDFFQPENNSLGGLINVNRLNTLLLGIEGVQKIETLRTDLEVGTRAVPKINFINWDPFYPEATALATSQSVQLKFFEFPYFNNIDNLVNRIEII